MAPCASSNDGVYPAEMKGNYSLSINNNTKGPSLTCNANDSSATRPPRKDNHPGRPRRLSNSEEKKLQRGSSDMTVLSSELSRMDMSSTTSECEQITRCECCGLSEECTGAYVNKVRGLFCGRFICGLCAEAVKEERNRMGPSTPIDHALQAHISLCANFNNIQRRNPAVHVAQAMRQLLKKKSMPTPKTSVARAGNLARSTSCIPALK